MAANINRYFYVALSIVIIAPLVCILGSYQLIDAHQPVVKLMMYLFWKGPVVILIGSVAAILMFKGIRLPIPISKYYLSGLILFVAAVVIQNKYFIGYRPYVSDLVCDLVLAYVTATSINGTGLLATILKSSILVRIGIISYSIYIWQALFIGAYAWEPWLSAFRLLPLYLIIIVKLLLVLAIALLSWHFFESKILKLRKKFK